MVSRRHLLVTILSVLVSYRCYCEDERAWRDDNQCGGDYVAPNGKIAECNPEGISPCCSPFNWCGITAGHCDCEDCIEYRVTGDNSESNYSSEQNRNSDETNMESEDEDDGDDDDDDDDDGNGLSPVAVVAIAAGIPIGLIIIIVVLAVSLICFLHIKRSTQGKENNEPTFKRNNVRGSLNLEYETVGSNGNNPTTQAANQLSHYESAIHVNSNNFEYDYAVETGFVSRSEPQATYLNVK